MATVEWIGLRELQVILGRVQVLAIPELAKTTYSWQQEVMHKSLRLCPIDVGYLRSTAKVGTPEINATGFVQEMGYGAEYAIPVHEITDAQHNPPTQAKFLEQPFNEDAQGLIVELQESLSKVMSGVHAA